MNTTAATTAAAFLAIATAAAASAQTTTTPVTRTFQNGAAGYLASKDASINTQYAQYNGGNGTQWGSVPQLAVYTTTGSGSYAVRYLLKFPNLGIAAGQRVTAASLTLNLESWNSGAGNITGFYLRNEWDPAFANLGWIRRDATRNWSAPGASAAGTDTVAGKTFQVPALRPVGNQTLTIPLDLAQVQSWIDTPATNQGILLVNNVPGEIIRIASTTATQQNLRPKLTITTSGATTPPPVQVTVSPTSATLQTGQTQQFTANTSVTWTSTAGGTINSTGLFTAGSAAATVTVRATSVADPTKSATATVTIQVVPPPPPPPPPPTVSVTISPTSATLQTGQTRQFAATVTGSTNTAVTWTSTAGGSINTSGLFTAGSAATTTTVRATSVADPTKSATATVTIQAAPPPPPPPPTGPVPRMFDGPYVVIQSPVSGMRFTAPATIRIYADPHDAGLANPDGHTVTFLLNGQSIGIYTGSSAQNGYFALTAQNIPAGTHTIAARITSTQGSVITSAPVTVYVDNPAASTGPVYNLTSDVVLTGTQSATYAGTAANRCTINGNGYQIRSAATGFTGSLTISYCNIRNLGTATNPSIQVTANGASGSIQLTNNVLENFGTVSITANDQAQAVIRNNEFRENTLVPVTSLPMEYSNATLPVFRATGNSSAQKYFQGNNVGLSTVAFDNTRNWLIGGSTDAESNVLMGVRCGFTITRSTAMVLRGNYSQHNYPHRFSQGQNFELQGDGFLAEHNVIRSSSWPVRGMGGELRYNLIDASGNSDQVLQGPRSNLRVHHNIFVFSVSQTVYSPGTGFNAYGSGVDNIQFHNNVMDGGGVYMTFYGNPFSVQNGAYVGSLRNNVFYNFASRVNTPALSGAQGESTNPPLQRLRYADYNAFYNPDAVNQTNYGLGVIGRSPGAAGYGLHDLGGFNGKADPRFTQPTAIPFPFAPQDIWTRTKKVSDVLAAYRIRYSPAAGSPLIAAGDPQDGANTNIGAIGNGEAADLFGRFPLSTTPEPPPPPPPPTNITISVAPNTVTLNPGGSQQFTATVTGSTNTAVTWTSSGGGGTISTSGLYAAGTTEGSFTVTARSAADTTKTASATVVVVSPTQPQPPPSGTRPRMILDTPMLTYLRTRAQARTAEWTRLKAICDSYLGGGTIYYPGQNGYPNKPSVGEGYQGSGYIDALMPLGVCYHSTLLSDPPLAAQYGAKAVAILLAMSDPNHTIVDGRPVWLRDYGYGIRNFGVAMGLGYDWFHGLLTAANRTQLQTSLSNWLGGFENDSFEYDHPQGNYFAGYYATKCFAALAVEGDSPLGATWWNDWYNNQHLQRVAPYYAANLKGGGWTEGFMQYGVLGTRNQTLPVLAAKTAKGIDLTTTPAQTPYTFPLDQARYLMAFTWPTRDMHDDRGELYDTGSTTVWPGIARLETYRFLAGFLRLWGDPLAPAMHKYARDMKTGLDALRVGDTPAWVDFLFWDDTYSQTPSYETAFPLSYLAPGIGGVAARSDWTTSATFLSFLSSPYINFPSAGHEAFDKGSLAIQRNRNPLLVNAPAWLTHEPYGSPGWTATFDDRFGNFNNNRALGNRTLYNTFQVRHLDTAGVPRSVYGQWAAQRSDGARTSITRYEDGGSYVLATGQYLEDMYRRFSTICTGRSPVDMWTRQIVYLRPSLFVVHDRTAVCDPSLDQYLAFHFPANPVEAGSQPAGIRRFDVSTGQFAGSMTTVLPANAVIATTDRVSADSRTWNKLWRTEVRGTGTASSRQWLTVFDLAATREQVATATQLNVSNATAVGTLLQSPAGNAVVIAGTAPVGTPIAGTLQYTIPAAQATTRHIITDLVPSASYSVSVANGTVTIVQGGTTRQATANGVLTFTTP